MERNMLYYCNYDSPVGKLTIMSDEENIVGLFYTEQDHHMETMAKLMDYDAKVNHGYSNVVMEYVHPVLMKTTKWLKRYFAGENPDPAEIPMKLIGTDFRKQVWEVLREIPYGETRTYQQISERCKERYADLEKPFKGCARAVAGAVGHNPISILIPCHRILGADGSLTGYAGGLDIKESLLKVEGIR